MRGYKTKKGRWIKEGQASSDPAFPGSYADYDYERAAPSTYQKTDHQSKIGSAMQDVHEGCQDKDKASKGTNDNDNTVWQIDGSGKAYQKCIRKGLQKKF